jgi:hypothetical protein
MPEGYRPVNRSRPSRRTRAHAVAVRAGRRFRTRARVLTSPALVVAGLGCFTVAAFHASRIAGWAVAGAGALYLEWLQRD